MPSPTRQQTPTYNDFIAFMHQMQKEQQDARKDQQNFQKNMVDMIKTLTSSNVSSQASSPSIDVYGLLMNEIESFNYDADGTSTFDDWFKRHGVTINERGKSLTNDIKRNLIIEVNSLGFTLICE
ncbi:unnamed protein product [Caenorhabditis auriculariae]|uniref:DUF7083 domain-containing protein n=1 Tax=Caenorhabditis auriculariae TaxID=2777116 RepID=A0A8S1HM94_9PELO|nr:unnamed protein product [Caenorhabditis auriculariae]